MKKLFFLSIACCLSVYTVFGQVKGKVTADNAALPGATLQLIHLPDSVITKSQMADKEGRYLFDMIKPGKYKISCHMVGFNQGLTAAFEFIGTPVILPDVKLSQSSTQLKEVAVVSNLPELEQKSDRLVVNLSKLNTTGDNALEVLKRAPGIRLDKDENILLRGNGGVNVMIDGKTTYMSGTELSNYLKSLPASALSKIELIANPAGNYDAEGTAGIVNLIMKRNHALGYNGNATLTAGYGKYGKLNGGVNLNYNINNVSFYTRINEGYSNSYNKLTLGRQIGTDLYDQYNYWHPINYTTTYTVGADYNASKKSTFGIMFKGYNSPQNADVTSESRAFNSMGTQTQRVTGENQQKTDNNTYNINLNYSLAIDSTGKKLSFDADYVHNDASDNETYLNKYYDANNLLTGSPINLRSMNPVNYNIYAIKGDYVHPFAKTWKLETGFKSSWVKTDNNAAFDSLKENGYERDPRHSNHFLYSENINAGYITLNETLKKWEFKTSLRVEQTISDANSLTLNQVIKRNYTDFFPSAFVTYKFNDDNQLNASYSRRITRPNYSSLNPFVKYTDPYTALEGNPFLLPSLSKSLLLGYSYKNFQILSLSYLKVNDVISRVIYQDDQTKESTSRFENLGSSSSLSATTAGSFNIVKWWNVSYEIDGSYDKVNTIVQNLPYHSSKFAWTATTNQNIILSPTLKLNFSAEYDSPDVNGLARMLSSSEIDAGVNKSFWKKRATVSFKARDIFFGNRYRSVLQYNNVNTTWVNEYESRRFSLGFTYTFGSSKIKEARDRKTSTGAEENRM